MDYTVFSFGPKDVVRLQELAQSSDPGGFPVDDRILWWSLENPFGGRYAVVVAGSRIVASAYLGGKPVVTEAGEIVTAFEIGDTWTHPEHRRRGLFSLLVRHLVDFAREDGAALLYGTPNSQSTPAYEKLGFPIDWSDNRWLWLSPNVSFAPRALAKKAKPVSAVQLQRLVRSTHVEEISADDYISMTTAGVRGVHSGLRYLDWRFKRSPYRYRFIRSLRRKPTLCAAFRLGNLGGYPILVVSECWSGQTPQNPAASLGFLRRAQSAGWIPSRLLGLYFLAPRTRNAARAFEATRGSVHHRQLPICRTLGSDNSLTWRFLSDNFVLSDCDIG